MKTIIAASAIALIASAEAAPQVGSMAKSIAAQARSLTHPAAAASTTGKLRGNQLSAESMEAMGKKNKKGKNRKYFEKHAFTTSDCSGDVLKVWGWKMGECTNVVDHSTGVTTSYEIKGDEAGPTVYAYMGHDCDDDEVGSSAVQLTDLGFSSDYELGDCADMGGYYAIADFSKKMHDGEDYSHVFMSETAVSYENCEDEDYFTYEFERAGLCRWDADASNWYMYDLSSCESNDLVVRKTYSDDTCATETGSENIFGEDCTFNVADFVSAISNSEDGEFRYTKRTCHHYQDDDRR